MRIIQRFLLSCLLALGPASSAMAWSTNSKTPSHTAPTTAMASSRRDILERMAFLVVPVLAPEMAAAVVGCSTTEGGCDTGGETSDFVARLKAQSDANREKYKKQAQSSDKLSTRQFSSQYDRPSYVGVRKGDATFEMITTSELEVLIAGDKVKKYYETTVDEKTGEENFDYSKGIKYAYIE